MLDVILTVRNIKTYLFIGDLCRISDKNVKHELGKTMVKLQKSSTIELTWWYLRKLTITKFANIKQRNTLLRFTCWWVRFRKKTPPFHLSRITLCIVQVQKKVWCESSSFWQFLHV